MQDVESLELILRGPTLPALQRAVEDVEVLAEPLPSGDRATLGGRDDQPLGGVELVEHHAELARERLGPGQAAEAFAHGVPRGLEPHGQLRHGAEQGVGLHHRGELSLAIGDAVRRLLRGARASSSDERAASRRPPNGDMLQPSRPS